MSNIDKVRAFIAKWEARDVEGIMNTFGDTPFYHNIPMDPLTSKAAIRAFIEPFMAPVTKVQWTVHFIAEDANGVVLTERVDAFHYGDKRIALPVMGSFEFEGDKLVKWRDYFDLREFETQAAALQG
ncbi:MAG: limonene-1,2-epoxide hydrolase family protein [Gammaproteobacteria bacterium]